MKNTAPDIQGQAIGVKEGVPSAYAFLRRFIPHRVSIYEKMLDVIVPKTL